MKLNEVRFAGRPPIDGYGAGGFRIGGFAHAGGLLLLPERIGQWTPSDPMTPDCFADAIAAASRIDVLLVGMGATIAPLPAAVRAALDAAGIGYDVMATPAACRTFNVLLAEDRRVAAVLKPV
ncbi:MAG: Mth938-like domain-containing protein [Rubrimonas sp.]